MVAPRRYDPTRVQWLTKQTFRKGRWLKRAARLYRRTLVRGTRAVAIVGSLGKTTTARAVAAVLDTPGPLWGGLNETTFVGIAMLGLRPWHRVRVIEVGIDGTRQMASHASMVRPAITVVTSIASEHQRSFGTLDVTRHEKADMVRALPSGGHAVLNGDDPNVLWMRGETGADVITYGFDDGNDVRATDVTLDWPHGTRFTVTTPQGRREIRVRLIGRTLCYSALAAIAVGLVEGVDLDTITARLQALPPTPERLQPVPLSSGAVLLRDDFKSTLETIHTALDVLESVPARRRFVILGSISEPPTSQGPLYRDIGARVAEVADRAIFFGDKCQAYAAGAARAGMPRDTMVKTGNDIERLLEVLPTDLGAGDVVLVKGRDKERLGRAALALIGRDVTCRISPCDIFYVLRCDDCSALTAPAGGTGTG